MYSERRLNMLQSMMGASQSNPYLRLQVVNLKLLYIKYRYIPIISSILKQSFQYQVLNLFSGSLTVVLLKFSIQYSIQYLFQ
jgi:hypothetical protein